MRSSEMLKGTWIVQKAKEALEAAEEDDSEDEAPLAALTAAPSDEELHTQTLAILADVELNDFSMKDLLRRLGGLLTLPLLVPVYLRDDFTGTAKSVCSELSRPPHGT